MSPRKPAPAIIDYFSLPQADKAITLPQLFQDEDTGVLPNPLEREEELEASDSSELVW
jgi:hypothetical protein